MTSTEASRARVWTGDSFRRVRAALSGSVLTLTYHRVSALEADPDRLAIPPEAFEAQMAVLASEYHVLRASELCTVLGKRRRLPRRAVVVTFDDGYADLLSAAKPILERHGVPATAFVSTREVGTDREKWWDEVQYLRDVGSDADSISSARLADLPPREREDALEALAEHAGVERPRRAEYRTMTEREIRELSSGGLVEIGAHTVSHRRLSGAPPREQREEIVGGKDALEAILGERVTMFSYPFGGRDALTAETKRLVAQSGFSCAFANWFGLAFPWTDRYAIPRCPTEPLEAEEFAARLDHWFAMGR